MFHIQPPGLEIAVYVVLGLILLGIGIVIGRFAAGVGHRRQIARREQELFTAQKGFRSLYEQELGQLHEQSDRLREQVRLLSGKVEDYRKKAAGFGGLFSSHGKRAEAMYALLMENEALEEALYAQNDKLRQERTDTINEQLRTAGYRRVLMSQLLNDNRIKSYVTQVLSDERRLPEPREGTPPPGAAAQ
jgi:cell division protein FtsB